MNAHCIVPALLVLHLAACTRADATGTPPLPTAPVHSPLGFSLVAPPGPDWTESASKGVIEYDKQTDPAAVTFYAGAVELDLAAPPADQPALAAFVRLKKDGWGNDRRFTETETAVLPDPIHISCVRYRMTAHDHQPNHRKDLAFLILQTAGRLCTHPVHPQSAVDIFYSLRHVPGYDTTAFVAEGEAFIDSLAIDLPPDQHLKK